MEQLFENLQHSELKQIHDEEKLLRQHVVGSYMELTSLIATHFLRITAPDDLPIHMFELCDWDNDGLHNFEEAVQFAAITSDGPLDIESWQAVCNEAGADPSVGLRFTDYTKLMDNDGDFDQNNDGGEQLFNGGDHAFTARFDEEDRARGLLGDGATAPTGISHQNYIDMYVRSAPTASVGIFDSIGVFDTSGGEKSTREILSQLSAKPQPISDEDDPTDDVGEILRELGNVTDLTGLAAPAPEKKRRRRKKKTNDPDKPKPKKKEAKEKRTTKGLRTARLKTIICRNWQEGSCKFGDACGFAHGEIEMQTVQTGCTDWKDNGACKMGNSCSFTHNGK
eukprot:TRINITY_DN17060_c0_g1_i1.p1 TRINITY_DN17060_c0_g1~~TRINITY_DN17060_c0_g1_i1.p1  ORF type:complete len:338 (+),score=71.37 TRINITY_DN17060_c0_g1_i1:128-1141(+)